MTDHLDSKNLVPFSKRRRSTFQLPGIQKDRDEEMLEQVDPDLRPEDEGLIRRYLHYADTLLGSPESPNLTVVPRDPAKRPSSSADQLRPINISSYGKPQVEPGEHGKSNGRGPSQSESGKPPTELRNREQSQAPNDEQNKAEPAEPAVPHETQGADSQTSALADEKNPEPPAQSPADGGDNGRAA